MFTSSNEIVEKYQIYLRCANFFPLWTSSFTMITVYFNEFSSHFWKDRSFVPRSLSCSSLKTPDRPLLIKRVGVFFFFLDRLTRACSFRKLENLVSISSVAYVVLRREYIEMKKIHNNGNLSRCYFVDAEWRIKTPSEWSTFVYVSRYNLPRRHYTRDFHNAEIRLLDKYLCAYPSLFLYRVARRLRAKCSAPSKSSSRGSQIYIYSVAGTSKGPKYRFWHNLCLSEFSELLEWTTRKLRWDFSTDPMCISYHLTQQRFYILLSI